MSTPHAVVLFSIAAVTGAGCTTGRIAQSSWLHEPAADYQDPARTTQDPVRTQPTQNPPPPVRTTQDPVRTQPPPPPPPERRSFTEERRRHPWEFTIGGTGSNDDKWDVGSGSGSASVGYYFNEMIELSARQSAAYSDDVPVAGATSTESVWLFQTRIALDVHFPIGMFVPYIGANIGYLYGDSAIVDDTLAAGPEAGAKIYLQPDAFLQVHVEWEFFENRQDALESTFRENFDEGGIFYFVGIGLRF